MRQDHICLTGCCIAGCIGGGIRMDRLRMELVHCVTKHDRAGMGRKGYNVYALGHYLGAVDDCMARIASVAGIENALRVGFNDRLLDKLLKAIAVS